MYLLNEMKYKQEETLFETLYLHLQEENSLFLPRKPCPRSWRTYCTSWFRASNWEDVPLLDQIDRKIFSVRNLYTFLGESSFESSESVQEQCSVASRVALIQCREQAESKPNSLGCHRAMASLNFRRGPWHSSPPRSNKEHVAHRIKGKENISR